MSKTKSDASLPLKVVINKEKTKVLFAEADSDFADVLLSFLTLPLGKIAKVLENHYGDKAPAFGSLSTLCKSLANLDDAHFNRDVAKIMLMNPLSSFNNDCLNLKVDISDSRRLKYYTCRSYWCRSNMPDNICMYYGSASEFCDCGSVMDNLAIISDEMSEPDGSDIYGGEVITKKSTSFIICDDLRMLRQSTGFFQTLKNIGIRDADGAELRIVEFGISEVIGLLKCCLLSETPLTDLILNEGHIFSPLFTELQIQTLPSFHQIEKKEDCDSKSINLKVMVQKSTNKLLFAQSEADFVELLFSFLTIPLGGVESLLENNTCLKSVDNLHRSLAEGIDDRYFKDRGTKNRVMNPELPHGYTSKQQFLPLREGRAPRLYYDGDTYYYQNDDGARMVSFFWSPKGEGNYLKEDATYMITDDLTVTPFCMTSGFNILHRLNIPSSDVYELDVRVGLEEALSILRASLTSNCALAKGLANIILMK